MRHIVAFIFALALLPLTTALTSRAGATAFPPLAVRVAQAGIVTISDTQLARAGWPLPLPRDRVTLTRHRQLLPLSDSGSGFAFVAVPNDSRWSAEAVYWLSVADTSAPRAALPSRLPTPLSWEPERLYERHHASARGDSWWAGELRGSQTLSAQLTLPDALPAGTPLQVRLRATEGGAHAVAVTAAGQPIGTLRWADPSSGAQLVTYILSLPALPAGPLSLDLTLAADGGETVLLDDLTFPTVFPPAVPISVSDPVPAVSLPGNVTGADLLIITHAVFRSALDPLVAAHAHLGQHAVVVDVQAAYDAFSFSERNPEAIRQLIRVARPGAVLLVGAGTTALRQTDPTRPTFLPPYLIRDAQGGETACDTCYTRLAEGDPATEPLPELPIGRLPVATLTEAQIVVAKTVTALTAPPPGAWQTRAVFLADNDVQPDGTLDPAGSFVATAETGIAALPWSTALTRLYYAPQLAAPSGPFEPDTARLRCRLFRALDGGSPFDHACAPVAANQMGVALWVYVGHGSPWQWASTTPQAQTPYLWYLYDADARHNGAELPILLSMTCLSGDFANPQLQTNDERLLLRAGGGVVASLSSSGEGVNTGHARLLHATLARLTTPTGERTLGAAHLAGLRAIQDTTPALAFAFAVLGDPLVTLPLVPRAAVALPLVAR